MNALQKKIGFNQCLYFFAVVGLLGVPYVLFSLEMTPDQMKQLLMTYAWEGILFCALCTWLPMHWTRIIPTPEETDIENRPQDTEHLRRTLRPAFRLPQKIAFVSLALILFAFAIGVLQLVAFVQFDLIQSLETFTAGVIIGVVYAICTFFNIERLLAPHLGRMVHQSGIKNPPRVFSIFSKVMIVCVGIMGIAVLFEVSISYVYSMRLLESELTKSATQELNLLKTSLYGNAFNESESHKIFELLNRLDSESNTPLFLLNNQGEILSGKPAIPLHSENSGALKDLFQSLIQNPIKKDIIHNIIWCAVPLDDGNRMLIRVIDVGELERLEAVFLKRAFVISGLILIVAIFLSYGLAFSVSEPIKKLNRAAKRIERGEFGLHPVTGSGDEVGALAFSFFQMETALKNIILKIKEAAFKINSASNEIVAAAEQQSSGAAEQASSVGETTATLEELSATARQIAENSEVQAGMAESTLKNAEDSLKAMGETEIVMSDIRQRTEISAGKIMAMGEKSQKIGKVLSIINDIAAETKMLSLNAAIEASRAGEAGKGFAVVAGEIRKLAENVVKSTGSIEEMLKEIQGSANMSVMASEENVKIVTTGVHELDRVRNALEEIVHMAEQSTDAAKEVSMTTGQQKTASEQTAVAMREISEVTRQMAAASTQTTRSVQGLHRLAKDLQSLIAAFQNMPESGRSDNG
jgi:methyl-accepting chemotaxis protein